MTFLVLVTLFLPYAKADQLSQEFVEPVKNWSFEEVSGPPCALEDWSTNNGGWQYRRTDINGDGVVNILDLKKVKLAYSGYIDEPRADVNCNGVVDILDVKKVELAMSGYIEVDDNRIHGSYSWYTSGGGDYLMWQWLDVDVVSASKDKGATFSFWFYPESVAEDGSQNNARAEIYYEYDGGSDTINGVWVAPTELNWWNAYVIASLPLTTTAIKVIIHGTPDFKAYIDSVSLSITNHQSTSTDMGNLGVGVNIYEWHTVEGVTYDGVVHFVASAYVEPTEVGPYLGNPCKVIMLELKVELLPNDGESTQQQGQLHVTLCTQQNNEGVEVPPVGPQNLETVTAEPAASLITYATGLAIGIGIGTLTMGAGCAISAIVIKTFLSGTSSSIVGAVIKHSLKQDVYVPDDACAEGGTDYFTLAQWWYPSVPVLTPPDAPEPQEKFIESAGGQHELIWVFDSDTADSFQIRVTATATFGELFEDYMSYPPNKAWMLIFPMTESVSTTVTIVP